MDRGSNTPSLYRSDDPPREELPETFVDRYTSWASGRTDSPVQYHRVHGMVILSTVISPFRAYETEYGTVKPNIWSMILAGTTLTRKTTSMRLALGLLKEVLPDFLMGTDGSPEGIFAEIAQRKGMVSMFHRDEISGWIETVTKREYMSGILDAFLKFYDGQDEKKVLRSASYNIEDPNFIIMSGGIQSKMEELVTLEHIRSGFIPRFIIVLGQTTIEEMIPIGPPKAKLEGRDPREPVLEELYKITDYVRPSKNKNISSPNLANIVAIPSPTTNPLKVVNMTSETWLRIQQLERDAMIASDDTGNKEIFDPMFQRIVTTIIKCSVLLATARLSEVVELEDLLKAISYSDEWVAGMMQFCRAVEIRPHLSSWERKVHDVIVYIRHKQPEAVGRSDLMRKFHLGKKQMDEIEATLVDREIIKISSSKGSGTNGRPRKTYEMEVNPFRTRSEINYA